MEGTPLTIEIEKFKSELLKVEGVTGVHDLHVWSLGPRQMSMSAHLVSTSPSLSLKLATQMCKKYKIYHSTLQIENPED